MILLVKNSKGGVGKSTITRNLAAGLSKAEYKVAIVSLDYQNGSLTLLGKELEKGQHGFKALVMEKDTNVEIKVNNIDYYALENGNFSTRMSKKVKKTFEILKVKYDFIFLDGAPLENTLNDLGVDVCDKILIPINLNKLSIDGVVRMLEDSKVVEKLAFIVPNLYNNRKSEKTAFLDLENYLVDTDIYLSTPILNSAIETEQTSKGKSIFDTKSKNAASIQDSYINIIEKIIEGM